MGDGQVPSMWSSHNLGLIVLENNENFDQFAFCIYDTGNFPPFR